MLWGRHALRKSCWPGLKLGIVDTSEDDPASSVLAEVHSTPEFDLNASQ
jgi:hypothetical protein